MADLWNDIQADLTLLSRSVAELRIRGEAKAKADAAYRALKAKAILEARADGVPATLAKEVIYAREDLQQALLERDCTEVLWDTCIEGINATKLQIRVNESQLERDWGQAKRS